MRRLFPILVPCLFLAACGGPSFEVCRTVTRDGKCGERVSELETGKQYVLIARRVPKGPLDFRVVRIEGGRESVLGARRVTRVRGRDAVGVPLTLPLVGTYRVVLAQGGRTLASETYVAPEPPARPRP